MQDLVSNYRLLYFKYIYDKLNLKEIEEYLINNKINYIIDEKLMSKEELICSKNSKYFYLLNDISFDLLNEKELSYLKNVNVDNNINEEVINFLEQTYKKVFFNNPRNLDKYYGIVSEFYHINGEYIVLGFKFEELGFVSKIMKKRKEIEEINLIIDDVIKKIESNNLLALKVFKYNELFDAKR